MYLWHLFCQADCIAPLPLGGVLFPFPHPTGCRYCRFPRRSSCSPLADYVRPAKLAYRVPLCLTPTLLLAAIFIIIMLPLESMVAHRTAWRKVVKFGTLVQDSPISPLSQSQVASPTALAPPTGQIWACIHVHNFRAIRPIFTNQVSLDFLNQAQFNKPYDVIAPWRIFPPSWFMSKTFKVLPISQILSNHLETWHTWSSGDVWCKTSDGPFKFKTVCPLEPIKFGGKAAKPDVSPYHSSPLTYHNQPWYIDPWPHKGDTEWIWWDLTPRGRCY